VFCASAGPGVRGAETILDRRRLIVAFLALGASPLVRGCTRWGVSSARRMIASPQFHSPRWRCTCSPSNLTHRLSWRHVSRIPCDYRAVVRNAKAVACSTPRHSRDQPSGSLRRGLMLAALVGRSRRGLTAQSTRSFRVRASGTDTTPRLAVGGLALRSGCSRRFHPADARHTGPLSSKPLAGLAMLRVLQTAFNVSSRALHARCTRHLYRHGWRRADPQRWAPFWDWSRYAVSRLLSART